MAIVDLFKLIFWMAVLILALSFFGISIQSIVNSPIGQENITYLTNVFTPLWQFIIHFATQLWLWVTYWIRPGV
ncbi:hypothetical protein EXS57_00400 [Candidatus Kaiserbacteria bacterium]|nr:hypothetical protein [Candidatus Kaiserbacteria bacterium]